MSTVESEQFEGIARLKNLRIEHRRLDGEISRLAGEMYVDQVRLRRLKKRKLMLKDLIVHIESEQIPDLNA
jgi:hypothetical protein